jgi:hypothetical protein
MKIRNNDHANIIVMESITSMQPIEIWNKAMGFAIEIVREVLREENSSLTYEVACQLSLKLHQQMLNEE